MSWWWFVPVWVWGPVWLVLMLRDDRERRRIQKDLDRLALVSVWDFTAEERAADRREVQALSVEAARGARRTRRLLVGTWCAFAYTALLVVGSLLF